MGETSWGGRAMKRLYLHVILLGVVLLSLAGNADAVPISGQMVEIFNSPAPMLLLGAGLVGLASYSRRGRKK